MHIHNISSLLKKNQNNKQIIHPACRLVSKYSLRVDVHHFLDPKHLSSFSHNATNKQTNKQTNKEQTKNKTTVMFTREGPQANPNTHGNNDTTTTRKQYKNKQQDFHVKSPIVFLRCLFCSVAVFFVCLLMFSNHQQSIKIC
jgi:hypothetical protein